MGLHTGSTPPPDSQNQENSLILSAFQTVSLSNRYGPFLRNTLWRLNEMTYTKVREWAPHVLAVAIIKINYSNHSSSLPMLLSTVPLGKLL